MNNIIKRVWNQNRLVNIEDLTGMAFQAEADGHTFEISGIDDTGAAVELSGTVSGVFRRPDNADIALTGSASDGVVSVTLSEDCYAVPGRFGLTVFVTSNSQKVAVYACVGTVAVSSTGNVAGDTPANVEDLIDDINAAIADLNTAIGSIPADYSQFMAAIAPTYSSSALYSVGSYAWYNGSLYRCITAITTAESWTAAHWTAAALGDDVGDLKIALHAVYHRTDNLYNPDADTHGVNLNNSGVETSDEAFKTSDYIFIGDGNNVTIQCDPNQWKIYFFTSNSASGYSRSLWITGTASQTFAFSASEKYIRITMKEAVAPFMVNFGDTLLPYTPYGNVPGTFLQGVIDDIDSNISAEANAVRNSSAQKNIINRFNKATINEGKYLSTANGGLASDATFFASDYIDVSELNAVMCSYTHIVCFYDANKGFISGQGFNTLTVDGSINLPADTKFMRFSTYNTYLNTAQIGENVCRSNYMAYGKYTLDDFIETKEQIVVDASGNGDYTSFTQAVYDNVDSGVNILVKPGTYNIVSEYVALFGQSAVDSMADADSTTFNGFQYGVRLRNRKVEFAPGAHLVCDWTGHTVDGTHRFSALGVDYNVEIIGLDLDATATFYCIHDDYGPDGTPYTVKYDNCRVIGHNNYNANCIGGGCEKYSRHILNNCYFDNNLTNSATVRYHNTNGEGSEPEIYVSNCYFNNWFTPRWYGAQTSKMRVYVNNCHARAIYKMAESSSFNVDNVELYKWNNEETDPRD